MTSLAIQYDFFESKEESEISALRKKIHDVEASNNKVRKKIFCENGKLTKRMLELEYRLEVIERGLCQK